MTGLKQRLAVALANDNTILVPRTELNTTPGFSEEYLVSLGLRRTDLKKLERHGLAQRGYTKNIFLPGDKLPSGRVVDPGDRFVGRGHRVRWILIADTEVSEYGTQGRESSR